jgi:hypothetical protein
MIAIVSTCAACAGTIPTSDADANTMADTRLIFFIVILSISGLKT